MVDAMRYTKLIGLAFVATVWGMVGVTQAQTLSAPYSTKYSIFDLGTVSGLPTPYGGLTLRAGTSSTLLIGGSANTGAGGIYSIGLTRDASNHINGFTGTASLFATAPNIDGGLAYAPNGTLLFTEFPNNAMGEIKAGSVAPDKTDPLASIASSVGSLGFVPSGLPGAGGFKIASYSNGNFYDVTLTPDGSGTFNVTAATLTASLGSGGPEGFVYVPTGSPLFSSPSMLVSEYRLGRVSAYTLDGGGNPVVGSRADFITGLTGAEGAFIDPTTGDFLFSTFGGSNHVIAVRGFAAAVPEPGSLALLAIGLCGVIVAHRRRKRPAA